MKNSILMITAAMLAACAPEAAEVDEPVEPVAGADMDAEMENAAMAPDGGPMAGTYEVTDTDGVARINVLNEDGTYTYAEGEEMVAEGTYTVGEDMSVCFDAANDDGPPLCVTPNEAAEDGSWTTVTSDDGRELTVRRVEG